MKLPARISKYQLDRYLGGGMSEVYQARDTVLGRTVAVKLLTAQAATNDDTRARFLLEARVSSGIAHENIITNPVADAGRRMARRMNHLNIQ